MKQTIRLTVVAGILALSLIAAPLPARAEQPRGRAADGWSVFGSVILSILHVPLKLVTCVGTQTVGAVAYAATYGVEGAYDGGTTGREIGQVASGACAGDWIIPPEQVRRDYQ
jgi:hypothetical protein